VDDFSLERQAWREKLVEVQLACEAVGTGKSQHFGAGEFMSANEHISVQLN
jgi:hypothetical protein